MDEKAIFCHSSQRYDLIIILSIVLTILEVTTKPEFWHFEFRANFDPKTSKNGQKSHILPQFLKVFSVLNSRRTSFQLHILIARTILEGATRPEFWIFDFCSFWAKFDFFLENHEKIIYCHSSQRYDLIIILSIALTILEGTTKPEFWNFEFLVKFDNFDPKTLKNGRKSHLLPQFSKKSSPSSILVGQVSNCIF